MLSNVARAARPAPRTAGQRSGFTLVELLVVIGIIAVLIGILLPALNRARESANALKCSSNLRSVGQGIAQYLSQYKQSYPLAYTYQTGQFGSGPNNPDVGGGTAAEPVYGYVHWSSYIYGVGRASKEAFLCPSFGNDGGHPATNPDPKDMISGQVYDNAFNAGAKQYDQQVARIAYTVNEAIMGRNKTNNAVERSPDLSRRYAWNVYVKAGEVRRPSQTILATEMNRNINYFQDGFKFSDPTSGTSGLYKTHRPVNGVTIALKQDPNDLTLNAVKQSGSGVFIINPATPPPTKFSATTDADSSVWYVGRNHGRGAAVTSNFLYVDGHVETRPIEETLGQTKSGAFTRENFQWGDRLWSLAGKPEVKFTN